RLRLRWKGLVPSSRKYVGRQKSGSSNGGLAVVQIRRESRRDGRHNHSSSPNPLWTEQSNRRMLSPSQADIPEWSECPTSTFPSLGIFSTRISGRFCHPRRRVDLSLKLKRLPILS